MGAKLVEFSLQSLRRGRKGELRPKGKAELGASAIHKISKCSLRLSFRLSRPNSPNSELTLDQSQRIQWHLRQSTHPRAPPPLPSSPTRSAAELGTSRSVVVLSAPSRAPLTLSGRRADSPRCSREESSVRSFGAPHPGFPANDLAQWMSSTPTRLVWPRRLALALSWCVWSRWYEGRGS